MEKLSRANIMTLECYAQVRSKFRREAMAHKGNRRLALGDNAMLYFEDFLTMQYQAQEILRVERIFEPEAIEEELAVCNSMIPDGTNWKATFMLQYTDVAVRRQALSQLIGVEDKVYVRVQGFNPVYAVADEDLPRETADKTSSVHFLRFELSAPMIQAAHAHAEIQFGVDHPRLRHETLVSEAMHKALVADLAPVATPS